jgi:hypothetical protein
VSAGGAGTPVAPFVFLHIEKTSATSLRRAVIEPNVPSQKMGSMRAALREREGNLARGVVCYHGHVAHGFHRAVGIEPRYVTMLRDPVDRAVSYYYFIQDTERTDLIERHPLHDLAASMTVAEFFELPRFADMQTRRLAGWWYTRAYPHLHERASFRRAMLDAARRHLDAMPVFGLQDFHAESERRFMAFLRTDHRVPGPRAKKTSHRPSVAEIREIRPSVVDRLIAAHRLDAQLYAYARERFAALGAAAPSPAAVPPPASGVGSGAPGI